MLTAGAWRTQVYDNDANPLQALDDIELSTLLPQFLALLEAQSSSPSSELKVVDLGCGTGRNTCKLLTIPRVRQVVGLDASAQMLALAKRRCEGLGGERLASGSHVADLKLELYDMLGDDAAERTPETARQADAVISTLVLEHVPANVFFKTVAVILKPGGLMLLTNMHAGMGSKSQAGFKDPETGQKIRPVSYAHKIEDVLREASRWGLEPVGKVHEREARMSDVKPGPVGDRLRKWIGVNMWFGMVLTKVGAEKHSSI